MKLLNNIIGVCAGGRSSSSIVVIDDSSGTPYAQRFAQQAILNVMFPQEVERWEAFTATGISMHVAKEMKYGFHGSSRGISSHTPSIVVQIFVIIDLGIQ